MTLTLERHGPARSFATLDRQPPDALLAVIGMHRADPRPHKIDLGVGVYRNADGVTPVMRAIKMAEARLLSGQETKGYLGAEGDPMFVELLAPIALGERLASDARITGIQAPGGTGALRLGAELLARSGKPTVWVGTPTWPNHAPIFREAGLEVHTHTYFDAASSDIDFDSFLRDLRAAMPGDIVLLHGCCHNPTGSMLSADRWAALTQFIVERDLIPFVDLAYQGLGRGLDEDAAGPRALLTAAPEALVAYSCDKNFGLYRERVGALWVQAAELASVAAIRETMLVLARSLWSMPPDHGAAAVRAVLEDVEMTAVWQAELAGMRTRINALRSALGSAHPALAAIARQEGLFALLPITQAAVAVMRADSAIYMPDSGRINIAGLSSETMSQFVSALTPHLPA